MNGPLAFNLLLSDTLQLCKSFSQIKTDVWIKKLIDNKANGCHFKMLQVTHFFSSYINDWTPISSNSAACKFTQTHAGVPVIVSFQWILLIHRIN